MVRMARTGSRLHGGGTVIRDGMGQDARATRAADAPNVDPHGGGAAHGRLMREAMRAGNEFDAEVAVRRTVRAARLEPHGVGFVTVA